MKAKRIRLASVAALVWDVVAGVMSDEDIAAKHELGQAEVKQLRKGQGRPNVARWIRQWKAECQKNPSLHLALMKRAAVEAMAKAMGGSGSSTSLAAAKEFLNHTLGSRWIGGDDEGRDGSQPAASPRPALDLMGLPRGLKLKVLRALGGPVDFAEVPAAGPAGGSAGTRPRDGDDDLDTDLDDEDDQS